ncbi:MAG: hypothetical protein IH944_10250 [Armatimonadetes bacterium]|nr:hypothetical protein [Armatimonadota bacterium]
MVTLGWLDLLVLGTFLAAVLALGFSARLRENTTLQFIAAGRTLTLPIFVATLVATWYAGILGIGEAVRSFGLGTLVLLGVPYYLFALLYALVFARRIRQADQISIPERLHAKFGRGAALIGSGLIFLLGTPAAHVLMLGILVQAFTGWSLVWSVIIATIGGTLFLFRGGLLADARVSLLSFAMMYVGFAIIATYCLVTFPIGEAWSEFRGTELMTWDGGTGWLTVISFLILGAWTLIDPGFHQRVTSAASPEVGRKGVFVCIGFWFLFDLMTITTGMYALALLPKDVLERMSSPFASTDHINPLLIYPLLGDAILPAGLKAMFLAGILGTVLTGMVGYALVSGSTFGRDLIGRALQIRDEGKLLLLSRIGIVVACVAAVVIAFLNRASVVSLWYAWGGCVVGSLLLPVMAAYGLLGKRRFSGRAISVSMAAAFIISVSWLIWSYRLGNEYWMMTLPGGAEIGFGTGYQMMKLPDGTEFGLGTLLPGLLVSAIVLAVARTLGRGEVNESDS